MVIMCFAMSMTVSAEELIEGDYKYEVVDNEAIIVDCTIGYVEDDLIIPDTLGGYPVTEIGDYAFRYMSVGKQLVIPEGVKRIGVEAFSNSYLTNVKYPDSLEEIGESAFAMCYQLKNIDIGKNVKSIGKEAFFFCREVSEISVDLQNQYYLLENNMLMNKEKTEIIKCSIDCNITKYVAPNSITRVEGSAFMGVSTLKEIVFQEGLIEIGRNTFMSCKSLETVTFPLSIKSIGLESFWYTKLKDVFYAGSEYDWNNIDVIIVGGEGDVSDSDSDLFYYGLARAKFHYSSPIKTVSSTCIEEGYTYCDCPTCEAYYHIENLPIAPDTHDFNDWTTVGNTAYRNCTACGYKESKIATDGGDVEIGSPNHPDCDFDVDHISDGDERYVLVENSMNTHHGGHWKIVKIFDITLKNKDGVHVQPDGTVKVKLPHDWKHNNYKVYRVNDDGTITDMKAYQEGSHIVFETDHFSLYVIVDESAPDDEDSSIKSFKDIIAWFKQIINDLVKFFRSIGKMF